MTTLQQFRTLPHSSLRRRATSRNLIACSPRLWALPPPAACQLRIFIHEWQNTILKSSTAVKSVYRHWHAIYTRKTAACPTKCVRSSRLGCSPPSRKTVATLRLLKPWLNISGRRVNRSQGDKKQPDIQPLRGLGAADHRVRKAGFLDRLPAIITRVLQEARLW